MLFLEVSLPCTVGVHREAIRLRLASGTCILLVQVSRKKDKGSFTLQQVGVNNTPVEPVAIAMQGGIAWDPRAGVLVCVSLQCTYGAGATGMGDCPGNRSYLNPPHEHMRHLLPRLAHSYIRTRVKWDEPSFCTWERVHGG